MKRSNGDVCDKCDGAHPSHQCPYYPLPRHPLDQIVHNAVARSEERAFKRQHAEEDKSYLKSFSQEQRDDVLAKITYVEDPVDYLSSCDLGFPGKGVINYSQWYATMNEEYKTKTKIPEPSALGNGDCLQFGDFQGVNRFYVLWLRRGSYTNEDGFDNEHVANILARDDSFKCEFSAHPRQQLTATELPDMPLMVKRSDENGPNFNPEYECYLFVHPDEFGYSPAMVVSSAPLKYYYRLGDIEHAEVDPLLTHSKSEHSRAITEAASKLPADDVLWNYIGVIDEEWYPVLELVKLDDGDEYDGVPPGHIRQYRAVMDRHFCMELEQV